jgi:diguanylate cyclase (GGDEF)-like protein/PAS domain S-box-containing protein
MLSRYDLGPQGTVVLRDQGLGLIVRSPAIADQAAGQVGNSAVSPEFRAVIASGTTAATFYTPKGSDQLERIIAFQRVANAPMLINAGMASADYLAGWHEERNKTLASTGAFMLFSLVLGLLLWRMLNITTQEALRNQVYLRTASDGIQITDASGRLVEVNDQLCNMLGYSRSELLALGPQLWSQCWPDGQAQDTLRAQASQPGAAHSTETRLLCKDGSMLAVEVRCSHFYWSGRLHLHASVRDIAERRAAAEEIERLAFYDPLTQLPNRRLMLERLNRALVCRTRHKGHCALLMIDIDNFKVLNDTLGHGVGDQLLVEVATRLQACVRQGDTAARMGGDEFVVILEDLDSRGMAASQAETVAEKILRLLRQPFALELTSGLQDLPQRAYLCTSSIGIAMFSDQSLSTDELLMRADTAMYQAKAAGRNTVRFFDPAMQSNVDARAALEHDLRLALAQDQLRLYYQPQVDSQDRIIGAEVLLRWQHPVRGLVLPGDFIPLAEDTGLILPIGAWVLESACAQLKRWAQHADFQHLTVSVNVSARQFRQPDFVEQVQTILQACGAKAHLLKLELTESLMVNSVQETVDKMEALHADGISFSLDDFGTGYSSLSYLQRLPLDQLKIDQSFVRDLLVDSKDAAIAQTVVNLAQNLGLSVIAEGVETRAQRDFLSHIGCHAYQGYFFGRPCPLPEFEQLLSTEVEAL